MSQKITGIAASEGIAIAPVYLLVDPVLTYEKVTIDNVQEELARLNTAVDQAKGEIKKIRHHAQQQLGEDEAQVFDAHLLVLEDPEYLTQIQQVVEEEQVNAELALDQVTATYIQMFEAMEDNPYMQERAADLKDVSQRLLAALLGVELPNPSTIDHEVIVVAHDLTPSDTAQLNKKHVKAFVTEVGGRTSHSAIMARSLEIPAIVGATGILDHVQQGQKLIVDAIKGEAIVDSDAEELKTYQEEQISYQDQRRQLQALIDVKSATKDGKEIEIAANIGTPKDLAGVKANGADGVGLYRTEFLYMDAKNLPSEDEQYAAYRQALCEMHPKGVVVRTMDIGGDKSLPYLDLPKEMNPFLGYRAIRISLDRQEMFKTQLRALLRASVHGNLKIMFPMIATVEEFRKAKEIFQQAQRELQDEGIEVSQAIELGIMIEIPAAAVIADQFAQEVDFFSIGTNDLIQYTMASDRMNEQVAYLYQPYHPAILRLVHHVIQASHQAGKWTGMCGEMAADPIAIPLLLGLGLDEFSMSASSILPTRKLVSEWTIAQAQELAQKAITECATAGEVVKLVRDFEAS